MATVQNDWRCALVTGGGAGIGHSVACRLAAGGANVGILDLRVDDVARAELLDSRASTEQRIEIFEADVTDAPAVRSAVNEAVSALGPPDLVVHSAGMNITGSFHLLKDDEFRRVLDVNLVGSRNLAYATLRHMEPGSRLVLIASMGGMSANWGYGAYSSSKFGVVGLAGVLRMECHPLKISVSVVCPPHVPTAMSAKEDINIHPVQRELKSFAGEVSLEQVSKAILSGASKRKFLIIPGFMAKVTYWLLRFAPLRLQHLIANKKIDKVLKQHPEAIPNWSDADTDNN